MITVSLAIIKLCLVTFLGFYLYKIRKIDGKILDFLTFFVINFTVPFLMFSNLIGNSDTVLSSSLWVFVVLSIVIFAVGCALGLLFSFKNKHTQKSEFVSLISFQNAGYLPINIAYLLFAAQIREQFLVYVFLYLLGFNVIMWSLGSFFIFKKKGEAFKFKSLFTPPITFTIIALIIIYTNLARFVPSIIHIPMKMIGETSFVLSMIILGCWLARVNLDNLKEKIAPIIKVVLLKLIVTPLLFLFILVKFKVYSLFGLFVMMQVSMPSAASLPIITTLRKGDSEFVSQGVFATHIISIIMVPIWLMIYLKISGLVF